MTDIRPDDLIETRERIASMVHRTPSLRSQTLDDIAGCRLVFKCESFQRAGAFKVRGASNVVSRLGPDERARGVVCHSSGNHAQAVALVAREHGIAAHVVMPETAPRVKQEAARAYGATVVLCEPTIAARHATVERIIAETGAIEIPPYDHDHTIMGQATVGLEILDDAPDVDAIYVPVSGGGLAAGIALAAAWFAPDGRSVSVVGAEPSAADDARRGLEAGHIVEHPPGTTVCDGLRAPLCDRTFAILQRHVDRIVAVDDDAILAARRLIEHRLKVVCEPSGACAFAALLAERDRVAGQTVAVVVSGGNADA